MIINRAMSDQAQYGCKAGSCSVKDVVSAKGQFAEYSSANFKAFTNGKVDNAGSRAAKDAVASVAKHGPRTNATFYIVNPHGVPPKKGQVRSFGNVVPSKVSHIGGVYLYQVPHQVRSEGCVERHWCH